MSDHHPFVRDVGKLRTLATLAQINGVTDPRVDELPYYSQTHAALTRHLNDEICRMMRPGDLIMADKMRDATAATPLNDIYPGKRDTVTEWCEAHMQPGIAFPRYGDSSSISIAWGIALLVDAELDTEAAS